jgi:tetratricopeptide (TPR) repeat protein
LAQAQAAAVDEDLATARSHLEAAIADSPGLAPAHYNLGVISEWMGRTATAKKHYQQALQADPEFMSAVVASARLMVREGNTAGGIAFAQQQSARLPDSLPLANAYDRIRLLKPGQASSVIASAKKVLRRDEKNAAAMANLAQAYHQQGKYELAIAILGNAQVIEADNPELLMLQALAHDKLEEPMRARLALEKAIGLPGGASAEAYNNLGLIYYKAGDFQGAEAQFRKALARWPNMLAANVNLGNALKSQKRFVEGESALKRAITIDPNNADVYYNLGILYLDGDLSEMSPIKRLEAALGYFEQYKQKSKAVDAKDPVVQYMEEARKRIDVEKKRAEQMRRAAKQPAAAPATTDEGGAE